MWSMLERNRNPKTDIMDEHDYFERARLQLDLVLSFFPRVDGKASVVLAVDTGMLGFLAARVVSFSTLLWWQVVVIAITIALLGSSLWFIYKEAFPNLKGGSGSLVYFREIANRTEAAFIDDFLQRSRAAQTKDILGQVWRNSEILRAKFDYLRVAFILLAVAILPWVASLLVLPAQESAGIH